MKITINNKTLLNALNKVTSVIEKRNTIPILSNIHIDVSDGVLKLQGTDLDITISSIISDIVVSEEGSLTASASMLSDIVKRLPEGDVTLEYKDDTLHVKAGRSKFKMQTLPSVDFPEPKSPLTTSEFTVEQEQLKSWLDRVSYCISTEETRIMLNGVFMHITDEGYIRFVAIDGHRFAMQDTTVNCGFTGGIIIPRKTIAELVKLCTGSEKIAVSWNDSMIVASNSDTTLTSKLIDATFPEYQRIIPQANDMKMVVDAELIKKASDRVASINDERTRAVRISCRKNEIDLFVKASNGNDANETLDAECDFELEIGVNSRYLADAMSRIDGDVEFAFRDGNSPMLAKQVGDDSYLSLIMPMRH